MLVQHDLLHAVLRLLQGIADQHALSESQAVGFQYNREIRRLQIGQGLFRVVEILVRSRGDSVFFHQILGKGLGTFQDGRVFPGAEHAQPLGLEYVHDAAHQRIVHAYHGQVDFRFLRERRQLLKLHGSDGHALGVFPDARVAWGAVYLFCLRALGDLPRDGVLAAAGAYD